MDKLGVDESIDQAAMEKAAAHGCPECGGKVTMRGNIAQCERCGTEPFESKKKRE